MSKRSAIRTVKHGTIKLNHRLWQPSEQHMKYDGRLDGQRFLFIIYEGKDPLLALWGTEAYSITLTDALTGPYVVDGTLPWQFWYPCKEVSQ